MEFLFLATRPMLLVPVGVLNSSWEGNFLQVCPAHNCNCLTIRQQGVSIDGCYHYIIGEKLQL